MIGKFKILVCFALLTIGVLIVILTSESHVIKHEIHLGQRSNERSSEGQLMGDHLRQLLSKNMAGQDKPALTIYYVSHGRKNMNSDNYWRQNERINTKLSTKRNDNTNKASTEGKLSVNTVLDIRTTTNRKLASTTILPLVLQHRRATTTKLLSSTTTFPSDNVNQDSHNRDSKDISKMYIKESSTTTLLPQIRRMSTNDDAVSDSFNLRQSSDKSDKMTSVESDQNIKNSIPDRSKDLTYAYDLKLRLTTGEGKPIRSILKPSENVDDTVNTYIAINSPNNSLKSAVGTLALTTGRDTLQRINSSTELNQNLGLKVVHRTTTDMTHNNNVYYLKDNDIPVQAREMLNSANNINGERSSNIGLGTLRPSHTMSQTMSLSDSADKLRHVPNSYDTNLYPGSLPGEYRNSHMRLFSKHAHAYIPQVVPPQTSSVMIPPSSLKQKDISSTTTFPLLQNSPLPKIYTVPINWHQTPKHVPKKIIVYAKYRSGSTFTSLFLSKHKDFYFTYEPLQMISKEDRYNESKVNHWIRKALNCNYQELWEEGKTNPLHRRESLPGWKKQIFCFKHNDPVTCSYLSILKIQEMCQTATRHVVKVIRAHTLESLESLLVKKDHVTHNAQSSLASKGSHVTQKATSSLDDKDHVKKNIAISLGDHSHVTKKAGTSLVDDTHVTHLIHLVRDPRALISSRIGLEYVNKEQLEKALSHPRNYLVWLNVVYAYCNNLRVDLMYIHQLKRFHPEVGYTVVRYEDMAMHPVQVGSLLQNNLENPHIPFFFLNKKSFWASDLINQI